MTTIITKNSSTASAVPAAGSLVQGELAVNVTDKKLYTKDSSGTVQKIVGSLGNQEASSVAITGGSITGITDLAIADGGTGASTASDARNNLGLGSIATQNSNSVSITGGSISGITDLAIADGGTGASDAATARTNLGLGSISTQAANNVAITGGSITGITDLAIVDGGTGASTANDALNNLLPSQATASGKYLKSDGTNASWDQLDISTADITGTLPVLNGGTGATTASGARTNLGVTATGSDTTYAYRANNLSDLANAATARTNLGLGSIATQAASSVAITGGTIDGTAIGGTTTAAGAFTTLAASGAVTLSGGTANGVAYLNGSKVLTTGSALTFDGTTFAVGGAATGGSYKLQSYGASGNIGISIVNGGNAAGDFDGLEFVQGAAQKAVIYTNSNNLTTNVKAGSNIFQLADVEQMRLTSTGLGIGTSSPSQKLAVVGNGILSGTEPFITVRDTSAANKSWYFQAMADTSARIYNGSDGVDVMRFSATGNVGIGVTPSAWGGSYRAFQLPSIGIMSGLNASSSANYFNNSFFNGTSFIYSGNGAAARYEQAAGVHAWYNSVSGTAGNAISFTQAMTLNASGNLGLGATPSAWDTSVFKTLQIGTGAGSASISGRADGAKDLVLGSNVYYATANFRYVGTGEATMYRQEAGLHKWFTAASGTAGNAISFTQAMTLDASGNLGLGVTPPALGYGRQLTVSQGAGTANPALVHQAVNADDERIYLTNNMAFATSGFSGNYTYVKTGASASYYLQTGGSHRWYTAPSGTAGNTISFTQAMTLDASGNLIVGATSPIAVYNKVITVVGSGSAGLTMGDGTRQYAVGVNGGALQFYDNTASAERARIDSSGNLLVGQSSTTEPGAGNTTSGFSVLSSGGIRASSTYDTLSVNRTGTDGTVVNLRRQGSVVGSISVTTTATAYNTSSDYRLKNIDGPLTGSGEFIDALKPKVGTWKADGSKFVGFLAHEVQEVSPQSVVGTKDAVDEEGKPIMQAMEYGSAEFIANIVAELQSLRARVAQLESKGA